MNEKIRNILSASYGPCPGFAAECEGEMRWAPRKGHAPRGFCGAEGSLEDIEVIFVFAEPGDPLGEENHPTIDDAISCARKFFKTGIDVMHKNVRFVMDLLWPGMSFDEQMKKCLFTDSVLCSAPVERGRISSQVEQACVKRYFVPLLELVPQAKVIAFGNKAQNRLASGGFTNYIPAKAVAPPEGNKPQARESWIEAVKAISGDKTSNVVQEKESKEISADSGSIHNETQKEDVDWRSIEDRGGFLTIQQKCCNRKNGPQDRDAGRDLFFKKLWREQNKKYTLNIPENGFLNLLCCAKKLLVDGDEYRSSVTGSRGTIALYNDITGKGENEGKKVISVGIFKNVSWHWHIANSGPVPEIHLSTQ
ncbi:MAG: hypothetical protein WCV56_08040 [Candidatus Omnitrophota bacterium]